MNYRDQFSDYEEMIDSDKPTNERRKCFSTPDEKYNNLLPKTDFSPSEQEILDFNIWLSDILHLDSKKVDNRDDILLRFQIFVHFRRLNFKIHEIHENTIRTLEEWTERGNYVMEDYVSYIKIPLDTTGSYKWWCKPEIPKLDKESEEVFVCHSIHTFTEKQRKVKDFCNYFI